MKKLKLSVLAVAIAISPMAIGNASAKDMREQMMVLLEMHSNPGIMSLQDAVKLVMTEQSGLVKKAEIDGYDDQIVYEIEIASDQDVDQLLATFIVESTVVLSLIVSKILGIVAHVDRPFVIGLGEQWVAHSADPSFPSDHATFLFCIAATCFIRPKWRLVGYLSIFLAFLNGWARVAAGIHFPLDILGALCVGWMSGGVIYLGVKSDWFQKWRLTYRI